MATASKPKNANAFALEEEQHPSIMGVLGVRVLHANKVACEEFQVVPCPPSSDPHWDQLKHFPTTVIRNRKHPFNMVQLEVMAFESDNPGNVVQVGSIAFHLHDIISYAPVRGTFDIFKGHIIVGEVSLDLSFAYGMFGYGYSTQVKDDYKTAEEHLDHSMYPRIDPPLERQENMKQTLIPKAVLHPSFLDFKQKVQIGYGQRVASLLEHTSKPEQFPDLEKAIGRYHNMLKEYRSLGSEGESGIRRRRLNFLLHKIMEGTIKDEMSSDGGANGFATPPVRSQPMLDVLQPAPTAAALGQRMQQHHEALAAKDKPSSRVGGLAHQRSPSMYALHYKKAVEEGVLSDADAHKAQVRQDAVRDHTLDRLQARKINRRRRQTLHSRAAAEHAPISFDSSPVSIRRASAHPALLQRDSLANSTNTFGAPLRRNSSIDQSPPPHLQRQRSMSHASVVRPTDMNPKHQSADHSAIARALALKQARTPGPSTLSRVGAEPNTDSTGSAPPRLTQSQPPGAIAAIARRQSPSPPNT